jgi:hypothetical protein
MALFPLETLECDCRCGCLGMRLQVWVSWNLTSSVVAWNWAAGFNTAEGQVVLTGSARFATFMRDGIATFMRDGNLARKCSEMQCSECKVRKCAATCIFKLDGERRCVHFVNVAAEDPQQLQEGMHINQSSVSSQKQILS